RALLVHGEVEKAVPADDAAEPVPEIERAHVGVHPARGGKPLARDGEHRLGKVGAPDLAALLDQIAGDGLAGPAAQIEHRLAFRHESQEAVEPSALDQAAAAMAVKTGG